MKDGFIKVAAAVPELRAADTEFNARSIVKLAREAAKKGVKICVFPELCVTGATCGDLFLRDELLEAAERALFKIIAATYDLDTLFCVGVPLRSGGEVYNCAAFFHRGSLGIITARMDLPQPMRRWFSGGPDRYAGLELHDLNGMTIYDSINPPSFVFKAGGAPGLRVGTAFYGEGMTLPEGASVVCCLSSEPELSGKSDTRRFRVKYASMERCCGLILASSGEGESTADGVYSGCRIVAENGKILAEGRFSTGCAVSELDLMSLAFDARRRDIPARCDTTNFVELEPTLTVLTREISASPCVPDDPGEAFTMQTISLRRRAESAGAKKLIVGVSGGLDSTLALLAAVNTGVPTIAVTMPCFGTTERTKNNAVLLAEALGAELRTVDITESVRMHLRDIGHDENDHNAAFENAQARERTQVLMDIANDENGLVVGTGDMSELALGWCTYNGDHMSMYGVNSGLPKTAVRAVVNWYAEARADVALSDVLRDILATPISPELLPGQVTEELVGPYELHDFFLWHFLRFGAPPEKLVRLAERAFEGVYERAEIIKWLGVFLRRFFTQQFKRSCSPDGPRILEISLSPRAGFYMPSDASAALWLRRAEELA